MNAPEKLQESLVDYFPIDKLHPSPTNPREVIVDARNGKNLIVARGEQIKEALRAAGVPPVDPLDRDDDEADTPFDTQFDAYEKANRSIAAASIDKLIDSPAVWAAVAEKMLVVPAREQIKIAHLDELHLICFISHSSPRRPRPRRRSRPVPGFPPG